MSKTIKIFFALFGLYKLYLGKNRNILFNPIPAGF